MMGTAKRETILKWTLMDGLPQKVTKVTKDSIQEGGTA